MKEFWKKCIENELYEISDRGNVRRLGKNGYKLLSLTRHPKGYYKIRLNLNGVGRGYYVHRLVASAFCKGRSQERWCVNHKNGIKTDNRKENLEWCSVDENNRHANLVLNVVKIIPVVVFGDNGEVVKEFDSYSAASKSGFSAKYIMPKDVYTKEKAIEVINRPRKKYERSAPVTSFVKSISKEDRGKIMSLKDSGYSTSEISRFTGYSWYKVSTVLKS